MFKRLKRRQQWTRAWASWVKESQKTIQVQVQLAIVLTNLSLNSNQPILMQTTSRTNKIKAKSLISTQKKEIAGQESSR